MSQGCFLEEVALKDMSALVALTESWNKGMLWSRKGPPKEGASEIRCYLSGTKEATEAQGKGNASRPHSKLVGLDSFENDAVGLQRNQGTSGYYRADSGEGLWARLKGSELQLWL